MTEQRLTGKIIKLAKPDGNGKGGGWGFIVSKDKPFTRIYFHWSGLKQTTKHFLELELGMKVEFDLVDYKDMGWRAYQIEVIE